LERPGQRQFGGPSRREAEAGIIGRVAEQDHRAMAASPGSGKGVIHQRRADAEPAVTTIDRERSQHQRRDAAGTDGPQPYGSDQLPLAHRREGKAFGGRASVTQPLAGAHLAVGAKAGIEQRLARDDVRRPLRADREWNRVPGETNGVFGQGSHRTSVLASKRDDPPRALSAFGMSGTGAGEPAPDGSGLTGRGQMW